MISQQALVALLVGGGLLVAVVQWVSTKRESRNVPPGPNELPVIGNMLDMPTTAEPWVEFASWSEKYGSDIVSANVMGNRVVVLNSFQTCVDLLNRRADLYSDRPVGMMANVMMGWGRTITGCRYGERWMRFRSLMHQTMRKEAVNYFFNPIQQQEVYRFLGSLVEEPERYTANVRFASGRALWMGFYGLDITNPKDKAISYAEEAINTAQKAAQPSRFLVDYFPALWYVPDWFPGTRWKQLAKKGRKLADEMVNVPFERALINMRAGSYTPSFVSANLKKEDPDIVKWAAGSMYAAGTETIVSTINAFVEAMSLYPNIQKRAQAEIDAIVGTERVSTIQDRSKLPFVNALQRELMRWKPASPLALPHRAMQDDEYHGYFIPEDSTVIANIWAITRDPLLYDDPEVFSPDRFLSLFDKSVEQDPDNVPLDPMDYVFGYGHRACPGKHYADSMVFLVICCVLHSFDIGKVKDEGIQRQGLGEEVGCVIKPRSEGARRLVVENARCR